MAAKTFRMTTAALEVRASLIPPQTMEATEELSNLVREAVASVLSEKAAGGNQVVVTIKTETLSGG